MDKNTPTKLTLEHAGYKMTWEGSWDAGLEDIMHGFVGCLRGIGFGDWIIDFIRNWCNEKLPDTLGDTTD
jgi:hypothetical protein